MAFRYTLGLGAPVNPSDVAKRTVKVDINGTVSSTDIIPPADLATFQFTAELGQNVSITTNDLDAAGNVSPDSPVLTFVVTDTVPPAAPAMPTITGVEQIP